MQSIIQSLKQNLKVIYRKAVDADNRLKQLQHSGMGKHGKIFVEDAGFEVESRLFLPYVQELSDNIDALENMEAEEQQPALAALVKKIEQMHLTLVNFEEKTK
jgi:primosomal protein N''